MTCPARYLVVTALMAIGGMAQSQSESQQRSFAAASVKPAAIRMGGEGGNRSRIEYTPTSLTMLNVGVSACVQWAYGVASFQISSPRGDGDNYDILATAGTPVTPAQLRMLLQDLLAKRFHLGLHHETKMLPVYELRVAKSGRKLPVAVDAVSHTHAVESLPRVRNDDFLFSAVTMGDFAQMLSQLRGMDLPVVDRTGIAGTFDLVLKSGARITRDGEPSELFTLIERQLGLELVSAKAPIEVLVIDHFERPTAN